MHDDSLRDFIARLEKAGELKRVSVPVSTQLEMTEILTRVMAEGGPAVLFEHPLLADGTQSDIPVLANLFGTVKRVAMGVTFEGKSRETAADLREVGEVLADMRQPQPPRGVGEAVEMLPMAKAALAMRPKDVSRAPCQKQVLQGDDIDLSRLPVMGCWPGEPAPLISWGMVVTKGPGDAREDAFNLGVYRMQVLDKTRVVMRWLAHRGGAQHYARWRETHGDIPMPVAVVIGADPGTMLSAVTPVPETLSEYQFAGLMRGARLDLTDCVTQPLKVPAEAEIVLEGTVSGPDVAEGPYGDHTGYYNAVEKFPVFTVSAITMRKDPVYLSTYTCRPPDEPSVMGAALNEMFVPLIRQQFPEIVDFWLPPEGCSYRMAVVSIKKAYPGHAKRIMMGVWSFLRQFLYTKWVIIVDEDINVRDWADVIWAITTRMDPARDITMIENTPIDYLDFASPESGLGSKIGMDATNKMPPEVHRDWGRKIAMDKAVIDKVTEKWASFGLPGDGAPVWK